MIKGVSFLFIDQQGTEHPFYLSIGGRAVDFGDDSWDLLISIALMLFLNGFLHFALKRVFDALMSPITALSKQLEAKKDRDFTVSKQAIDEVKPLTAHLNSYTQMKARLTKQEIMFAKYASHELKISIAVILGAVNLQAMKTDDYLLQQKPRERILKAPLICNLRWKYY